jgi:predicted nucleic acid-binding protein
MLILDTSAILNLIGTGKPRFVVLNLVALEVFIPEAVRREVQREPTNDPNSTLASLISDETISIIKCSEEMNQLALELAGAPTPDSLDDGESFAIACAACTGAMIGIDDRKARRVLRTRWPGLQQNFSFELITEAASEAKLPKSEYADLLYSALTNARMRIPAESRSTVIKLLGPERARHCPSLGIIS